MSCIIADMLTRIRNATSAKHKSLVVPHSKFKEEITKLMIQEGYLESYEIEEDGCKKNLLIKLKYTTSGVPAIQRVELVSKSGRRVYTSKKSMPRYFNGLGTVFISTNRGLMTDAKIRQMKDNAPGGEVIFKIY